MAATNLRRMLVGSASALVLSAGAAFADDATDPQAPEGVSSETETMIELGADGTVLPIDAERAGTAAFELAGMAVADVEGMDVFDESGDMVGRVSHVVENENGAVFLVVSATENSVVLSPGDHAVPIPHFDYNAEANGLVMVDGYATAPAAVGAYATYARLYTVLKATDSIEAVDIEAYNQPAVRTEVTADASTMDSASDDSDGGTTMIVGNARVTLEEGGIDNLIGTDILNREREDIGTVEEVAYNDQHDLFLIVSLDDGVLGIADSERAVEMAKFDYSMSEEAFILLDASEASLNAMPEFDSDTPGYTIIESDLDWAEFK